LIDLPLSKMATLQFAVVPENDKVGVTALERSAAFAGMLIDKTRTITMAKDKTRLFIKFHLLSFRLNT